MKIALKCCTCGSEKEVEVMNLPQFGFELAKMAQDSGWKGAIDFNYGRVLVFCGEDCYKAQLTKAGTIRKRLLRKEANA